MDICGVPVVSLRWLVRITESEHHDERYQVVCIMELPGAEQALRGHKLVVSSCRQNLNVVLDVISIAQNVGGTVDKSQRLRKSSL